MDDIELLKNGLIEISAERNSDQTIKYICMSPRMDAAILDTDVAWILKACLKSRGEF